MFDRKKYKDFARIQLKDRMLVPILMVLITQVIMTFLDTPSFLENYKNIDWNNVDLTRPLSVFFSLNSSQTATATFFEFLGLLIGAIFELATIHVYIKMSRAPSPVAFSDFIEGLSEWWRAVRTILWQFLWICLWTFLFIIPGFVKAYAYSQMFFLVSEFPDMSVKKAMKISIELTRGHKMDLFVMDLSFIGWFMLSILTFGLLSLYVTPFYSMTRVNAYHALLKEALESGRLEMEDLQNE